VLITGASSGIGEALARQLAAEGHVLIVAARRQDRLDALVASLAGRGHLAINADLSTEEGCKTLVDTAFARFPRIDTWVLNAGYGEMRPVAENTPDHIRAIFATNLIGTVEPIRLALPRLLKQPVVGRHRAHLVIVSSAAARRGLPYFGVYSATKAAQLSVAEALRVELRGTGIAVSTVHPVGTKTEFFDVAQSLGGRQMPPRVPGDVQQTADQVAAAIRKQINRPSRFGREIWPLRIARYGLSFATLFPGLTDRVMAKARKSIELPRGGA
jgi:short-subunit dehydrogenase